MIWTYCTDHTAECGADREIDEAVVNFRTALAALRKRYDQHSIALTSGIGTEFI